MQEIGRVCVKIAGRDAGQRCVIVDEKESKVMIDGQTRRRLVNPRHLEPTTQKLDIKKGASHQEVIKALEKIGVKVTEHKKRGKKAKE
jgi:large subunit ribosomal protein L14e